MHSKRKQSVKLGAEREPLHRIAEHQDMTAEGFDLTTPDLTLPHREDHKLTQHCDDSAEIWSA